MFKLFIFSCLFLTSLMSSAQVYVTHSDGRSLRLQPGTNFMFGRSTFDIKADDFVDGRRLRLSISSIFQNSLDVLFQVNGSSFFSECEIDWNGSQDLMVSFNRIRPSNVRNYYFTVEIINSGEQTPIQYNLEFPSGYGLDEEMQLTSSEETFSPVSVQKERRQRVYNSPYQRKQTNSYRHIESSPEPEPVEYDSNSMLPYSVKIQAKVRKAETWFNNHGLSALAKSRRVVIKFPPHLAANMVDVTLDWKNVENATEKALSLEGKKGIASFSSNGGQEQLHFHSAGRIEFLINYNARLTKVAGQKYELTIRMRNHSTVIYDKKLDVVVRNHNYESRDAFRDARAKAGEQDINFLMGL